MKESEEGGGQEGGERKKMSEIRAERKKRERARLVSTYSWNSPRPDSHRCNRICPDNNCHAPNNHWGRWC